MALKIEQLRTFLAVLEHGSFVRAADRLRLSQSAVTFQIAALEAASGSRLLDRGRGGVRLTATGAVLRRYAQRILALADEAEREVGSRGAVPTGRVTLCASTIVSEYLLPAFLKRFRDEYPDVSVTALVADSKDALDALSAGRCEISLVGSEPTGRSYEVESFAEDEIVLAGPPSGIASIRKRSDLAQLPLVLREPGSGTRAAVAHLLAETDLDRPGVVELGSTEAVRRCVLEGLGYSFLSRHAIAQDVRLGVLRIVRMPGTPVPRAFYAARLRATTPSSAAAALFSLVTGSK